MSRLFAGLALLAAALCVSFAIPRGPEEFSYFWGELAFPFGAMRGFTVEQALELANLLLLAGPGLVLLGQALARLPWALPPLPGARRAGNLALLASAAATAAVLLLYRGRAQFDDELTYAMQARLLARGRLVDTGPFAAVAGWEVFTVRAADGGLAGKYLPGEPLVQVPGVLLGLPALLHIPLAVLALLAFRRAVRLDAGERVAALATALVALSPFFVFTVPTGLSHATSLCCLAVAGLGTAEIAHARPGRGALLVALGLGAGLWVRPQDAVPAGVVWACWAGLLLVRARRWDALALAAGAGGALLALLGLANARVTGDPLVLPWSLAANAERYGFGPALALAEGAWQHTPLRALQNLLVSSVRLDLWWLGLPWAFLLLPLWWRAGRPTAGLARWGWPTLAVVLFLAGYFSPGVGETGPVYYAVALFPLAVAGAHVLDRAWAQAPRQVLALVVVHLLVGTGGFAAAQGARLARKLSLTHDAAEAMLAAIPRPAVLVYETNGLEARTVGWLHSPFPVRSHQGDLLTFPRQEDGTALAELLAQNPGHACWYTRFVPERNRPQLLTCAQASDLLTRPVAWQPTLRLPSTAERWGLLPTPPAP